jgi:MoxR-like ATPase
MAHPIDELAPVVPAQEVLDCQQAVREIYVDPKIRKYLLDIIQATREHDEIHLGGSPRASIALFRTAQAMAAVGGRNFVLPDDVKRMALPVLGHRLILRPESRLRKITAASVVHQILQETSVPVIKGAEPEEDHFQ